MPTVRSSFAAALALGLCVITGSAPAAPQGQSVTLDATPTPAEAIALGRAIGKDFKDMSPFYVARVDVNGDGRPDLVARSDSAGWCGALGCSTYLLLNSAHGYASTAISLASAYGPIEVLPKVDHGMHELRFSDGDHVFRWSGKAYR